ncbi:SpoIIE family protein phosphatase [Streptomyces sp. BR123]|uniref:SpoIIE family protein phosphatase n=1 Tax=Streptomyces sp. BR123 TaxID=2749828 RepID=UPI0015C4912E|nr:SpoIIE family protein phosphatase [Streptomyces sp. BR123]NXY99264.1 SpoIIE family protein phosphatase [Streptomyces sp. BR123]
MAERGTSPEVDWPAQPDMSLALNHMGTFDWDLDSGRMYLDSTALGVLDLRPDEFSGTPAGLRRRMAPPEEARLDARVAQALKDGRSHYGAYVRIRRRDGSRAWAHIQGHILRNQAGRPYRIIGILRDAAHDPGDPGAGGERAEGRRRMTGVVERTTAILAHARTVNDVTDVLKDPEALSHLGAVSVMLGIVDGGRIHLVAEGRLGTYVPQIEYTRIEAQFPMSEAVRNLQPVFIGSRDDFRVRYPDLWQYIEPLTVHSGVYLPLIAQGRAIGALGLLYERDGDFTDEERNVLVALGSGIAQSLQRAILFEQEHDLAEGLQRAMLPRRIPDVPGTRIAVRYRAARAGQKIGGDWYDVVTLGDSRVGLMIGDVQGHDTDAAVIMGQLRIVLRAYAAEGHTPGTAMARASAFLRDLATDRLAACTYAEMDLGTGMLQLVRAGHHDPVVRRGDGSCHPVPMAGGAPLGLPPNTLPSAGTGGTGYPVTSLELHPGDTLVLCTDGLLEQPGTKDREEGMRALMDAVCAGPVDVEELADTLCDLVGDQGGRDDMALLLLRRRGTPTPRGGGPLRLRLAPGDPEGPATARHLIRAAVAAWGAKELTDEIELAADELMTNALVHTDGGGHVSLRMTAEGRIRVEVEDSSSALPHRREAGDWAVSGRGLLLVERLAREWGVEPRGGGKCVWCEFTVTELPPAP